MSSYIVSYEEGEKETALALCNNRFMGVEEDLPYNCLVVSGAGGPIENLEIHDCIETVEKEGTWSPATETGEFHE